jgi:RimJ/RimL family protein N-acetyltransferase
MSAAATTPPTLTDGTVTLRGHRPDDVPGTLEQCRDPLSQQWTVVPVPYSEEDARTFVEEVAPQAWASGREWVFVVEVDGRFGGSVALRPEGDGRAEVAYGSHPAIRGTGAMERALRLLLAWGFEQQGLRTVVWWANAGNWASRRLAWRLGFSFDGTVRGWLPQRGELRDGWVGTLLRDDPREPRTRWLANPVVEGDGVRLRPFSEADVTRVVEGLGDADTQHWLAFMPRDPDEAAGRRYLEHVTERLASGHTVTWGFCTAEDDRLLGAVGIYRIDSEPELGYWTHPDARGRGLTSRAAALAVTHALRPEAEGGLGLARLAAYAADGNAASLAVLERVGMQRVGRHRQAARTADGTPVDLVAYDLLAAERSPVSRR